MVELAKRFDFRLETMAEVGFMGQHDRKQLDRSRLAGLDMDRLEDGSHAATAELSSDCIRSKSLNLHRPSPCRVAVFILTFRYNGRQRSP